ncbi:Glutamate 5-kinase [Sulfidibacter corallicola]|uniref:Glutamate 5-kinase n=1 Tax=Sulfidibacter corallicola TaxID=2818388 RepID=A0A8A4TNU3_SULCO|nr:glutamate 5-kinase [Sulfidibacter corallicola]QTD51220.1 glutamate 5-kinase [Sulfidibacter corallicola]
MDPRPSLTSTTESSGLPLALPEWKRAVIKVGSALVAPDGKGCSTQYLLSLARFITESKRTGKEVVLVSSGAVAAGMPLHPRVKAGRRSLIEKQALAAIGQSMLMAHWSRLFDFPCAQILLTHDDLLHRKRFVNAKNTLLELLKIGVLPIVNENDSVAVEELKVGDNDNLAAHVAVLAEADLLLIFSDIDGLFDADPRKHPGAVLIPEVHRIDEEIFALAGGSVSSVGTGGMITKLQAAAKASDRGIHAAILNGTRGESVEALLRGHLTGTLFHRTANPRTAKKHWISHALPCQGRIWVDQGAVRALSREGASLLPSGISRLEGTFQRGDAVEIHHEERGLVGKGITQYGAADLEKLCGCKSADIRGLLGYAYTDVIIHRNDLVLCDEPPLEGIATAPR